MNVKIKHNGHNILKAELFDTVSAKAIIAALPIKGRAKRWGDEIYFDVPILLQVEQDAQALVQEGDIAYWPNGHAIAIFFGATPASLGSEPRAVEPVNVLGRIIGDAKILKAVKPRDKIEICKEE